MYMGGAIYFLLSIKYVLGWNSILAPGYTRWMRYCMDSRGYTTLLGFNSISFALGILVVFSMVEHCTVIDMLIGKGDRVCSTGDISWVGAAVYFGLQDEYCSVVDAVYCTLMNTHTPISIPPMLIILLLSGSILQWIYRDRGVEQYAFSWVYTREKAAGD